MCKHFINVVSNCSKYISNFPVGFRDPQEITFKVRVDKSGNTQWQGIVPTFPVDQGRQSRGMGGGVVPPPENLKKGKTKNV